MKKFLKPSLYLLLGSAAGFAYYHFYGCTNGCPITSTWYISTVYGAVMGLMLGIPGKKENNLKEKDSQENDSHEKDMKDKDSNNKQ